MISKSLKDLYDKMTSGVVKELFNHLCVEARLFYGVRDYVYLMSISREWVNGKGGSDQRYAEIEKYSGRKLERGTKILDMASGCGNFVLNGLKRGLDVRGIDPAEWKFDMIKLIIDEKAFPRSWLGYFDVGYGEKLPYPDESFDFVSSCQTLEHVQDVNKCIDEMLRVLRPGGILFIRAPDYRGAYEKHYWLPWLPRHDKLNRAYLKALKRPLIGYEILKEITLPQIEKHVKSVGLEVMDLVKERVIEKLNTLPRKIAMTCANIYKFLLVVASKFFFKELGMNIAIKKTQERFKNARDAISSSGKETFVVESE